jgi:hypothetical protein
MPVQFTITAEDYIAAGLLNGEMTRTAKRIHYAIDAVLVISGVVALYYGKGIWAGGLIGAAIGGNLLPFILRKYVAPWRLRAHYAKYRQMRKPLTIAVANDGIKFESEDGVGVLKWPDIHHWRENDLLILIYLAPKIYHLVPKRIVEDGFPLEELKAGLIRNVGNAT